MRRVVSCCAALAGLWLAPNTAQAGAQQYAPMSAAVRYALSSAVAADRAPPEPRFASMQEKIDWLAAMAERLPRRWKPDYQSRIEFR
jgi:hypothetical protein